VHVRNSWAILNVEEIHIGKKHNMSTEFLIAIQAFLAIITAMVILLLIIRRQKKTINQLKDILTTIKEDISGENLTGYFQTEIDNTTAHCAQETIALRPDLPPDDMAISIRYLVLQAELSLIQDHVGATNTPWREQIKNYIHLAEKITDLIKARVDNATKTLNESHNEEISTKDEAIAQLESEKQDSLEQLNNLKPLVSCLESAAQSDMQRNDLELQLHKALLSICENFSNSENLRELVYLLHEAYHESSGTTDGQASPATNGQTGGFAQEQNINMLNNIIDQQNATIKSLKELIASMEEGANRESLTHSVNDLESAIQQGGECLDSIMNEMQYEPSEVIHDEKVNEVIETFIEESAVMVEKIHMLSNQNKQLMLENDEMRAALEASTESDDPLVVGLKMKLETQKEEMISLQQNFTELEERYLALYEEQGGNQAPPLL